MQPQSKFDANDDSSCKVKQVGHNETHAVNRS